MENFPRFDAAEHLQDEDDIAAYLTVVLEENDACAFAEALGTVAGHAVCKRRASNPVCNPPRTVDAIYKRAASTRIH